MAARSGFDDEGGLAEIGAIQGRAHTSPLSGQTVTTAGVVTATDTNGFYLQDPDGDGDRATSDGIFVFTRSAPAAEVGDRVTVGGTVAEFTPGGAATGNLSITQLSAPTVTTVETGVELPDAFVIGRDGLRPPTRVIEDDNFTNFDPRRDGIDFYESLEGARVRVDDPVVVGPTNDFGEIWTLADRGAGAGARSERGGILLRPDDANPERIQIDDDPGVLPGFVNPDVDVAARITDVTGVVSYAFGNYEVVPTEPFTVTRGGVTSEASRLDGNARHLTIATYNVENLDPNDGDGSRDVADGQFAALGREIVNRLNTPDIVALQEVQDNSGSLNDGVVAADLTLRTLVDAIEAAGGPTYAFAQIDPEDGTSGGQPGGNIRPAFLYDPARVELDGSSLTRVDPTNPAWEDSRVPLVGTFTFDGQDVTVINNHLASKGGSDPLFGARQDPALGQPADGGLDQREDQAAAINAYVDGIRTDADANIVVLGDLNDFAFSSTLDIIEGGVDPVLDNLDITLPPRQRYDYVFEGNSQSLDHILTSENLTSGARLDVVHINAEFAEGTSDHDPLVARLRLEPDLAVAGGAERAAELDTFL